MGKHAIVYLARIPQYQDRMRKYKVFLDNTQIGEIKQDETVKLVVEPGEHTLHLTIDWSGSNKLLFNANSNQEIYLECGNNTGAKFWKLISAITVARNTYLYVKRASK